MSITRSDFGVTPQGRTIEQFVLSNEEGVTATVINYGAMLTSVRTPDRAGQIDEITLGFDNLEDWMTRNAPYFGATVGRFANRIANAKFTLDSETYHLAAIDGPHHLHGGKQGFDKVIWDADIDDSTAHPSVIFTYVSVDGEEGYPGAVTVKVAYSLRNDSELEITYFAQSEAPTPINLTNHTYWNLAGAGQGDVLDHELQLPATERLAFDDASIPTGEVVSVIGTPWDFLQPRAIGTRIARTGGGYDHCYVCGQRGVVSKIANVYAPETGRGMSVLTTEPGFQLYTGNFLDNVAGRDGHVFGKHDGLCIEAQHFPDSPNHRAFPDTILRPGETYRQTTIHKFSVR